jgi:hypothetical protein
MWRSQDSSVDKTAGYRLQNGRIGIPFPEITSFSLFYCVHID